MSKQINIQELLRGAPRVFARPDRLYKPNEFITPDNRLVQEKAEEIITAVEENRVTLPIGKDDDIMRIIAGRVLEINEDEIGANIVEITGSEGLTRENLALACYAWVGGNIAYKSDKWKFGYPEYWLRPIETIKAKMGDCEDLNNLLTSLMLAAYLRTDTGTIEHARSTLGMHGIIGHVWSGSSLNFRQQGEQWYVMDGTAQKPKAGILTEEAAALGGYRGEWHAYLNKHEKVSKEILYRHYPLLRPGMKNKVRNLGTRLGARFGLGYMDHAKAEKRADKAVRRALKRAASLAER